MSRAGDAAASPSAGERMQRLIERLFPIQRSLTGDGVRETLRILSEELPLEVHEVPTGTPVLDWTVPREWNLREAWIRRGGETIVDARDSSLHVVGYSTPVRGTFTLAELRQHLHSLPEQPDLIPYRTSYYREDWGFCLPHRQLAALPEGSYELVIDSTLSDGHLTYGEFFLPGASEQEVLISCHVCHPALANDNLSGIAVTWALAGELAAERRRYGYRFLYIPGTLGSITWLARNGARVERIRHGLVAANLGDPGGFHYKRSRRGDAEIDRAVPVALRELGEEVVVEPFVPFGYDERQYSSPGFNLPVGSLTRTPYGRYPEYHTSADNLDFIQSASLEGSLQTYLSVIKILEGNQIGRAHV